MRNHIWVIEVREQGQWTPCPSAHLSKTSAKHYVGHVWKKHYPAAVFRIKKYMRCESK